MIYVIREINKIQYMDYSLSYYSIDHDTDISICKISGYIDARNSDQILKDILKTVNTGFLEIIFDLQDTQYISATGISVFESIKEKIKPQKGNITLINIQSRVMEIFKMYDYENTFNIEQDLPSAIESYRSTEEVSVNVRFPMYIRCPVCNSSLEIKKPMRFKWNKCNSEISVNNDGKIKIENSRKIIKKIPAHSSDNYKVQIYGENELMMSLSDKTKNKKVLSVT